MPVTIGALAESVPGETRVSIVPEVAEKLAAAGARVLLSAAPASARSSRTRSYKKVEWADSAAAVLAQADVLLTVQPPSIAQIEALRPGQRGHRLHAGARAQRGSRGAARAAHHQLCHGTGAAHLARAVDGRAVLAGRGGRLQGGADRRQHARPLPADADHRRGHDTPGAGADRRRRRRRTPGHRHGQAPGRGGRGLRRAQRHARAGQVAGREIHRDRRVRRGPGRLRARTDRRRKGQAAGSAGGAHRAGRRRDHHRRDPGAPRAAHHLARRGRAHEGRRGDRRHPRRIGRQLRTDARRRDGAAQRREDRRPGQPGRAARLPRQRDVRPQPAQLPQARDSTSRARSPSTGRTKYSRSPA